MPAVRHRVFRDQHVRTRFQAHSRHRQARTTTGSPAAIASSTRIRSPPPNRSGTTRHAARDRCARGSGARPGTSTSRLERNPRDFERQVAADLCARIFAIVQSCGSVHVAYQVPDGVVIETPPTSRREKTEPRSSHADRRARRKLDAARPNGEDVHGGPARRQLTHGGCSAFAGSQRPYAPRGAVRPHFFQVFDPPPAHRAHARQRLDASKRTRSRFTARSISRAQRVPPARGKTSSSG